jgi:SAM-dependent methyltransferase
MTPDPRHPSSRRSSLRRLARRTVERVPVFGGPAIRVARGVIERVDGRSPGVGPGDATSVPRRFRVSPAPRSIDGPWPEPPSIEAPMTIIGRPAAAGSSGSATVTTFDIDLFEQLNAEYADKPLVPAPRGNDAASATERARKRLEMVHESIDLADKRVLEFGCGAGYEVWTLAHRFGADAAGIDIDTRQAWETLRGPRVEFVAADLATQRPFPADAFDRIISFSVFEHVTHPHASAAELFRILRPGGLAWISANLFRGPMASHRYREVTFPWPHILFQDDVFHEFYRRLGRTPQGAAWVNRLSWLDYDAMFRRIGFRIRSLRFSERPIDEAFYERFESILGRYPRWDLERDFFHVVLEKPRR